MRTITDRERIALYALAAGFIKTWHDAFILAYDGTLQDARNMKSLSSSATHWKNRPETVKAFQEIKNTLQAQKDIITDAAVKDYVKNNGDTTGGGNERRKPGSKSEIDYYDPNEQKRQINKIILQSEGDPKTQLDAIKAIQQTQRDDKQAAKEGKTVKVYLPLTCDSCPLYQKARQKAVKG